MSNIPRKPIEVEPFDAVTDFSARAGRDVLAAALAEAGVELGAHDRRIAAWLGGFEATTAITVASWILRAHANGLDNGRDTI